MNQPFPRSLSLQSIANFRDLGGYNARGGHTINWRRLFRSAELNRMTENDLGKLIEELGIRSVIDLRSEEELEKSGVGLLAQSGIKHHHLPFSPDITDLTWFKEKISKMTDLWENYRLMLHQKAIGRHLLRSLELMADSKNLPLIFHCSAGKDRTGVLSAMLLSILGVSDDDIVGDYSLSIPFAEQIRHQMKSDPLLAKQLSIYPSFFFTAEPDSMKLFLLAMKEEYGSAREYLKMQGADKSLFDLLEETLLV